MQGHNMEWIKKIRGDNLLGIYDVALDIHKEFEISPKKIIIPLFPSMVKFPILCPMEGINHRDNYCGIRWKAIEFLKDKDIITEFELIKGDHRWSSSILIKIDEDKFKKAYDKMKAQYNLKAKNDNVVNKDMWTMLHPAIVNASKKLFKDKHYAQSAFEAMKEVNNVVKEIVKSATGKEFDGADLMSRAFSIKNPIIVLDNLSNQTGQDIQKGYMQIFAGAIIGIRNPKAHDRVVIDSKKAIHFLYLASLLMFKIDERIN